MESARYLERIHTPFDALIPAVEEPSARFYLDAMRIYLGLSSGTLSMEDARHAVEELKENPEFSRSPTNPILLPIGEAYRSKLLDNLKTLTKFNLVTADSLRSAYSFAFMVQEAPIQNSDLKILSYFSEHPLSSLVSAADELGVAPKTASRELERLANRNDLRFHGFLNQSAFNLQTIMVFFTPREDIEWGAIESALYSFPFTKILLKTSMTDLGYISVVMPNEPACLDEFYRGLESLSKTIFDYMSIHPQSGVGSYSNISLYNDGEWTFPQDFVSILQEDGGDPEELAILWSRDYIDGLTKTDFYVGAEMKLDMRVTPAQLSDKLQFRGISLDARATAQIMNKLLNKDLLLPYIFFAGAGLSANFCFEVVCNDDWKIRLVRALKEIPTSIFYLSSRGIVIWIQVPSYHQVDYYRILRSLEKEDGVKSVQPIMTIKQAGSRTVSDLISNLRYSRRGWTGTPQDFNLASHLSERL